MIVEGLEDRLTGADSMDVVEIYEAK